mmetsp:Transcript_92088/g.265749  ORF Transcript_92088/g.265749 Transcript_92088/m.265749 type:complete len:204 (+) Transcript_92088:21-632(+)
MRNPQCDKHSIVAAQVAEDTLQDGGHLGLRGRVDGVAAARARPEVGASDIRLAHGQQGADGLAGVAGQGRGPLAQSLARGLARGACGRGLRRSGARLAHEGAVLDQGLLAAQVLQDPLQDVRHLSLRGRVDRAASAAVRAVAEGARVVVHGAAGAADAQRRRGARGGGGEGDGCEEAGHGCRWALLTRIEGSGELPCGKNLWP